MRTFSILCVSVAVVTCCVLLAGNDAREVKVRLQIVDAETGKPIGGMIRVYEEGNDRPIVLPGLLDRLQGLKPTDRRVGWQVVPVGGVDTVLPRAKIKLEAVSGLETVLKDEELDLKGNERREITVRLPVIFRPEQDGLVAGNTHLHLMKLSLEQADQYLKVIPPADQLKVLFISYLERHKDDATYITNKYPIGKLDRFGATGVIYSNGEEHRHNFEGYGQGYGHVMFLDIKELVKPVSLGAGITGAGNDDRPLAPGIRAARDQDGTVIWCHNTNGYEFLPHLLAGRVDALNVFDGSRGGKYEDRYYRALNIGLKLPISTGTDWFLYDFARVYVRLPEKSGPLSVPSWLTSLKAGRNCVTNGPLLTLKVDGKPVGSILELDKPGPVTIEMEAAGRHDFQKLQLVQNGKVIESVTARREGPAYRAKLTRKIPVTDPAWFAARIDSTTPNEFDMQLFGHTSPVYVQVENRGVFEVESARDMLRELEEARATVKAKGAFSTNEASDNVLSLYDEAARTLREHINAR